MKRIILVLAALYCSMLFADEVARLKSPDQFAYIDLYIANSFRFSQRIADKNLEQKALALVNSVYDEAIDIDNNGVIGRRELAIRFLEIWYATYPWELANVSLVYNSNNNFNGLFLIRMIYKHKNEVYYTMLTFDSTNRRTNYWEGLEAYDWTDNMTQNYYGRYFLTGRLIY